MVKQQDFKKLLRESIDTGRAVIGMKRTLTRLATASLETLVLSKSVPPKDRKELLRLADLSETAVQEVDMDNVELGLLGKKPFSISVMGILKA
ncbi:MAG: 50S ribosomal protein L30 [DPANN group archaeon]|nr:50S ribosomal protein L30 [DPANN group archaeon]